MTTTGDGTSAAPTAYSTANSLQEPHTIPMKLCGGLPYEDNKERKVIIRGCKLVPMTKDIESLLLTTAVLTTPQARWKKYPLRRPFFKK
jgi:hypothetical protein